MEITNIYDSQGNIIHTASDLSKNDSNVLGDGKNPTDDKLKEYISILSKPDVSPTFIPVSHYVYDNNPRNVSEKFYGIMTEKQLLLAKMGFGFPGEIKFGVQGEGITRVERLDRSKQDDSEEIKKALQKAIHEYEKTQKILSKNPDKFIDIVTMRVPVYRENSIMLDIHEADELKPICVLECTGTRKELINAGFSERNINKMCHNKKVTPKDILLAVDAKNVTQKDVKKSGNFLSNLINKIKSNER